MYFLVVRIQPLDFLGRQHIHVNELLLNRNDSKSLKLAERAIEWARDLRSLVNMHVAKASNSQNDYATK